MGWKALHIFSAQHPRSNPHSIRSIRTRELDARTAVRFLPSFMGAGAYHHHFSYAWFAKKNIVRERPFSTMERPKKSGGYRKTSLFASYFFPPFLSWPIPEVRWEQRRHQRGVEGRGGKRKPFSVSLLGVVWVCVCVCAVLVLCKPSHTSVGWRL